MPLEIKYMKDHDKFKEGMKKAVFNWSNSMLNNLTNPSMNKIAYIGQGACCLYGNVPSTITMECWRLLSTDVQERSNLLALSVIKKWNNKNKNKQLCLNFD